MATKSKKIGVMLVGGMCSGKSYYAKTLKAGIRGSGIFSFACSLKSIVGNHYAKKATFSKDGSYPVYRKSMDGGWGLVSGRWLLQQISEAIKAIDYSWFYVETYRQIVESHSKFFIIDDCRFKEEYEYFKGKFEKVILVYLDLPKALREERCKKLYGTSIDTDHVSEKVEWAREYANYFVKEENKEKELLEFIKIFV